jgi:hypothetical protein
MCASGVLTVRFVTGATLRAAGNTAVAATLIASDPIAQTANVTVTGRTWAATLVQNPETTFNRPVNALEETGEYSWTTNNTRVNTLPINSGPNSGATFLSAATVTFVSAPAINSNVTNPAGAFARAQDKARMTSPSSVQHQVIPRNLYTVGVAGSVTITNDAGLRTHFNLSPQAFYGFTDHCIDHAHLLAGIRRHEHNHPQDKSHKGNSLKALRALDPKAFVEPLIQLPGATVDFGAVFQARIQLVIDAGDIHDIVDEPATRAAGSLQFVAGGSIPGVNADVSGNTIGPVWDPANNSFLQ